MDQGRLLDLYDQNVLECGTQGTQGTQFVKVGERPAGGRPTAIDEFACACHG